MAVRCAVIVCPNSYGKTRSKSPDLKYFQFPKDQSVREKWMEVCQYDLSNVANQSTYVCSKHFLPTDFERDLKAELLHLPPKRILKPEAVPALLLTKEQVREYEISQRKEKLEEFFTEYNKVTVESEEPIFNLLLSDFGCPKILVSVLDQKSSTKDLVEDSLSSSANHESDGNMINLRELCRLCGSFSDNLKSIVGNTDVDYYALIQEYIPTIEIDENDLLPCLMCSRCENSLVSWYQFLTTCDTVNQRFILLQNELKANKMGISKEEIEIIDNEESASCVEMETLKEELEEPDEKLFALDADTVSVPPTNDFSYEIIQKLKPPRKKRKRVFDAPVECEICRKLFRCSYTKKIHMRTVHTNERPYFCAVCNASFKRKDHMQCHISQVHDRNTRPAQRNARKPAQTSFLCAECGKFFASKTSYREHMDSVHNDVKRYHCAQCDLWFNRYSKYYHHKVVLKHARNDFLKACVHCGLEFQSEIYYVRHMTKHEQVTGCEKCAQEFASHDQYKEHVAKVHVTCGEYPCDVCKRKFASKTSLFHHKKSHSDNDKPFKCEYCNWRFRNRGHLSVHLYRHTGERPFVCNICNRGFKQKGDMRKHKAGHLLKPSISIIEVEIDNNNLEEL